MGKDTDTGIGCFGIIIILMLVSCFDCDGSRERDRALDRRIDNLQHRIDQLQLNGR